MTSPRILLVAGVLAILAHFAFAIKCYRCESDANENCGEHFESEGVMTSNCNEESPPRYLWAVLGENNTATGCAKITAKKQDKTVVIRQCYYGDKTKKDVLCIPSPVEYGVQYESCELCESDFCNGGASAISSIVLLVMVSATFVSIFIK